MTDRISYKEVKKKDRGEDISELKEEYGRKRGKNTKTEREV